MCINIYKDSGRKYKRQCPWFWSRQKFLKNIHYIKKIAISWISLLKQNKQTTFFFEKSQKNERYVCWDYFQYISQDLCPDNNTIATIQRDKSQKYVRDQSSYFVRVCMQITDKWLLTTLFISKMEIIPNLDSATPPLQWSELKRSTLPNGDKFMEQLGLSYVGTVI